MRPKVSFARISIDKDIQDTLAFRLVFEGIKAWRRSVLSIFSRSAWDHQVHTPWDPGAAQRFLIHCRALGIFGRITRVRVDLFGSLAKTGKGHGTDAAVLLGLIDADPVTCDTAQFVPGPRRSGRLAKLPWGGRGRSDSSRLMTWFSTLRLRSPSILTP